MLQVRERLRRCPVDTWHDVAATLANAPNEVRA